MEDSEYIQGKRLKTIKSKILNINVRYFLFAYEQVLEPIWYLYFSE
ncbi:MAG: hypothetical protein ACP5L4_02930 [Thermoplasmata archaeon]